MLLLLFCDIENIIRLFHKKVKSFDCFFLEKDGIVCTILTKKFAILTKKNSFIDKGVKICYYGRNEYNK